MPKSPRVPYLAVADSLRERLDEGEWLPGEAMPSVAALAAEFGVSASTAARAVRVLAAEGRLTIVASWGTFVAES